MRYDRGVPIFKHLVSVPDDPPPTGRWYLVRQGEILVDSDDSIPVPVKGPEALILAGAEEPVVLGWMGDELCWAAGVDHSLRAPEGYRWANLRELGAAWPAEEWALAGRAVQLVEWQRTHRYCGRCGEATEPSPGERAMRCPSCGLLFFPELSPAVIMLIRKGDQALLAANRNFRGGMYSVLAGFVEPGEDLEEAVHREVFEEVGIRLTNLRYVASQSWPFPHSLMIGYTADWASGEIQPDGDEILDARWHSVDELPAIPPSISIARRLIDDWVREVQGRAHA